MPENKHILMSLHQRHADNIFKGNKFVELRRRNMNIVSGTILWVYVTLPVASIIGYAKVVEIHTSEPKTLWKKFGTVSGLSKTEFFSYYKNIKHGIALELESAKLLNNSISLSEIRQFYSGFQPPQFFIHLDSNHPIFHVMKAKINFPNEIRIK